ncbi:hypothetical protein BSKO_12039 [Bryopsis sp. KO-2023]|nr:hypothetical protein BSKO_12039 [Bryopsis sp. KO-2023]
MNYLKKTMGSKRGSTTLEESAGWTGRAAYSQALEAAIERPGEINWDGVQEMSALIVRHAISPDDGLSYLKTYIKNNMPAVVLKALTIIDSLAVNCGPELHNRLASRKWTTRLASLLSSQDSKVKNAVVHLFSNWAHKYSGSELGEAYQHVIRELEDQNIHIPSQLAPTASGSLASSREASPRQNGDTNSHSSEGGSPAAPATTSGPTAGSNGGVGGGGFERGLDFLHMPVAAAQVPRTSTRGGSPGGSHNRNRRSEEMTPMTVQRIKLDVAKLVDAIQRCTDSAQALKSGKVARKEVLDHLNMAWVAAEKCNVWSENMQSLLMREMNEEDLGHLLKANDRLNSGLERWQALVSLDIANIGCYEGSQHDEDEEDDENVLSELGRLNIQRKISTNTLSDFGERQLTDSETTDLEGGESEAAHAKLVSQLREQNDMLKRDVAEATAAREAALAQAEAQFQKQLKEVKGKAVRKIKELMMQIGELQESNLKLVREREEAAGRLDSARLSLARASSMVTDENTRKLEAQVMQLQTELDAELHRASQREAALEADIKQLRNQVVELEVQIAYKDGDIESMQAEATARTAQHKADVEKMSNELQMLRANSNEVVAFKQRAEDAEKAMGSLKLELKRESILRKKAYNQIREMKGNIRVLTRVRPAFVPGRAKNGEAEEYPLVARDEYTLTMQLENKNQIGSESTEFALKKFEFDACFGPECCQEDVYMETADLIRSAFDGYNVCIFCYGQTGSGKTYTMTGDKDNPGIIPRAMQDVFLTNSEAETCSVSAYMLELYQDSLLDLLGPENHPRLRIKTDPSTGIVRVEGARICAAKSSGELMKVFQAGLRKRKTAATMLNIQSSRSHLIFTMLLERHNMTTGARSRSKITFVDLAGSERVMRSGAMEDKVLLNEAKAINKSLSALGDVVAALTSGESFIPYRNHKLTELMRDSLGGNAKTLMIVNVSPLGSDISESRNSLEYASRVKQVTNTASRSFETREITRLKSLLDRQGSELKQLRSSSMKGSSV